MENVKYYKMRHIRYLIMVLSLILADMTCIAQREYTIVKHQFCDNINTKWEQLNTKDDISFLMIPLTELKIDENYILSDFRKTWNGGSATKDVSALRLYVREKGQKRPNESYFDIEYARYLKCKKNNVVYQQEKDTTPYIWPFDKICLSGSQMSVWQAYLLDCSKFMFGMRNEANYDKEYLITSSEDIDSLLAIICNSWESYNLRNKNDSTKINGYRAKHVNDVLILIDSLQNIKNKRLDPIFKFQDDSVTIEHYSFLEFHGLVRRKTTLLLSQNHRQIKEIKEKAMIYWQNIDT